MWSLCVLCVLLSSVPGLIVGSSKVPPEKPGGKSTSEQTTEEKLPDIRADTRIIAWTDIFAVLGSEVFLPLRYKLAIDNDKRLCDYFQWTYSPSSNSTMISRYKGCQITQFNFTQFPHKTSMDGHLTLINVTRNNTGNYTVTVHNSVGRDVFSHSYILYVQAPVSNPLLNFTCRPDGGAEIICGTDTGEDLWFSIMVNDLLLENFTSSSEVKATAASPGPWDITCSVRNNVSDSETRRTQVKCPVPLSDPILEGSCLNTGSLELSCSVENGTDPIFSLFVNGTLVLENVRKKMKRVNVTLPLPGPWDVHCSVNNHIGPKKNNNTFKICPVPLSDPILKFSCHNGSLNISCSVEKGTDPIFNLSVNGILKIVSKKEKMVHFTASSPEPWEVHCSVKNNLTEKNITIIKTCSEPCLSCLEKSVIGGVVALIVTTSPLLIASFYIGRDPRKKH